VFSLVDTVLVFIPGEHHLYIHKCSTSSVRAAAVSECRPWQGAVGTRS
jgi:hypothetical protein